MQQKETLLKEVLQGLMTRYLERVPDVQSVIKAMIKEKVIANESEIENDHIAFRTMGVPHLGIQSLEKIFLHYGYEKRDFYFFPEKKLNAYWYSPPAPQFPRIFISELQVGKLSAQARQIIYSYTNDIKADPVDEINMNNANEVHQFLHSALWRIPTLEDYLELSKESEYAAWVIYNRYYLNHFTVSVHDLKDGYNSIWEFNAFLERSAIILNDSGGKYKQSPDGLLLQSSTVAKMIEARFAGGETHLIAGSYVEFAERKVLPQFGGGDRGAIQRNHRRDGFEAGNADKLFESTYSIQTRKLNA